MLSWQHDHSLLILQRLVDLLDPAGHGYPNKTKTMALVTYAILWLYKLYYKYILSIHIVQYYGYIKYNNHILSTYLVCNIMVI